MLVAEECGHAPIEIIEEGDEIEPKLDERFFLMGGQRPEDLSRVVHMVT